jgi:hypothetical protein
VVCVLAAGGLRLISPIESVVHSHGRDQFDLWIVLAVPLAIIAIFVAAFVFRLSPYLRARRLRASFPDALVTTGQWARETVALMPGKETVNQMATYSLVITPEGIEFHDGFFRSRSSIRIRKDEILWVNTSMQTIWQRSHASLVVSTGSSSIPLLLVDFARPLGMLQTRAAMGRVAVQARSLLGLRAA